MVSEEWKFLWKVGSLGRLIECYKVNIYNQLFVSYAIDYVEEVVLLSRNG